jgi:AraC-like DNA-binding protein
VAALAREVGVSRATLARRFSELVGEPPMSFLTGWRLMLAADLLREPGATVGSVAREVGYGSPFALSVAFERERGVSPTSTAGAPRLADLRRARYSQSLRLNVTYSPPDPKRTASVEVITPHGLPEPGYGTFMPYQPVISVGTAMIAAQPVTFFIAWFVR